MTCHVREGGIVLHNLREEVSEGEKSSGVACHQVFLYDHHSVDTLHQFLLQQQVAIDGIEVKAGRHRGYQLWGGGGGYCEVGGRGLLDPYSPSVCEWCPRCIPPTCQHWKWPPDESHT